jgi:hypothetical protein
LIGLLRDPFIREILPAGLRAMPEPATAAGAQVRCGRAFREPGAIGRLAKRLAQMGGSLVFAGLILAAIFGLWQWFRHRIGTSRL